MEHKYLLVRPNAVFLNYYHHYVKEGWRRQYFYYDAIKAEYNLLKHSTTNSDGLDNFENMFQDEINRVFNFLQTTLKNIEDDLETTTDSFKVLRDQNEDTIQASELTIRGIYQCCKDCKMFYRLNKFGMNKIVKKYEKLIAKRNQIDGNTQNNFSELISIRVLTTKCSSIESKIDTLTSKTIELYGTHFRKTFDNLATDELDFVKNKSNVNRDTTSYLGFKLGIITCLVLWLIIQSTEPDLIENDFDFWEEAGLFVYTTTGNLLLFRLTFATNVYLWSYYSINYIPLFGFHNLKPNLLYVVNQTVTLLLIYFINLLIYSRAYTSHSFLSRFPFFKYGCPLLLVMWTACYEIYDYYSNSSSFSRGLFSKQVLINCIKAPFSVLSFRDIYAADVLTSFTKVIADSLYSCCWLLSGSFLREQKSTDFGSSYMQCNDKRMVIAVGCIECLPMVIRMLQCFRQYYDCGYAVTFPFLFNALKYLSSIAVVMYALVLPGEKLSTSYLVLIILTTLYKWWWDCVMDWGLCDIMPTCRSKEDPSTDMHAAGSQLLTTHKKKSKHPRYWFLRPLLMYSNPLAYYVCVVLDLILRFLWVMSLVPEASFGFLMAPQLSFFLGSMEIIRRAMWGVFRLEYEHIKHVTKGTPGYLDHQHDLDRATNYSMDGHNTRIKSADIAIRKVSNEITSMPENNDQYLPKDGLMQRQRSRGLSSLVFGDVEGIA